MFGCWNVRGCNDPAKVREIRRFISTQNLCLLGLIDTKVRIGKEVGCRGSIQQSWKFFAQHALNGTGRIWIGWNPQVCVVNLLNHSPQWVPCKVDFIKEGRSVHLTVAYGLIDPYERRRL